MDSLIQPDGAVAVRQNLKRSMPFFDAHSAVFQSVSEQLLERLGLLAIEPEIVLDLGCRNGYQLAALQACYPRAKVFGSEIVSTPSQKPSGLINRLLRKKSFPGSNIIESDPHDLQFDDGSVDLVVSNLMLPWCHSPEIVFSEVARVLKADGVFMFTTAGPDTLKEYRDIWSGIDPYMHAFGLADMHDIGDALLSAGFAAPVLDRDNIQVDYPSIEALQHELRAVGAGNIASGRRNGLMSPDVPRRLSADARAGGRFVVSLELIHGHGWKGELRPSGQNSDSEYKIPVDSLRGSWSSKIGS